MSIFGIQKTLIEDITAFLKQDTNLSALNFYCNEVVFLQPYELPACLIYALRNQPTQSRERDSIQSHERQLEIRFELRSPSGSPADYEGISDILFNDLLAFKAANKTVKYVGNPTLQIGLVESQPSEIAGTLDVTIYYLGRP